jgi:hypothetical protein
VAGSACGALGELWGAAAARLSGRGRGIAAFAAFAAIATGAPGVAGRRPASPGV